MCVLRCICVHSILNAVLSDAVESGYTMIDTGYDNILNPLFYKHSKYVSSILAKYGRNNIFISTKVACFAFGYMSTIENIKYQMERLKTDYLDLVLISQPLCCSSAMNDDKCHGTWLETWRALEHLYGMLFACLESFVSFSLLCCCPYAVAL